MRGTVPLLYSGSFQGVAVGDVVWNAHTGKAATGRNFHTIESATLVVGEDTLEWSLVILLALGSSGGLEGMWKIIKGTEELKNVHGTGTLVPNIATPFPYDFLYSGNIHLDP